ncbi:protease complex subunit PrcB family protein [Lentibacillus salinarum]|uniref:Protease complex subunit PrcB family protein n=1 Tax=Lentibacillus salinarum TaxID=446820 RepID=A0ABW3ZT63_9BACI
MRSLLLMLLSALLLTGCGSGTTEDETMTEEGPIAREKTELSFQMIDPDEAPARVQTWLEKNRSEEAKKVFHADGKTYVIILLGQKSTGGYAVNIERMELAKIVSPESKQGKGTVNVTYHVTKPEEGSFNIQALTYPMAIAELNGELAYGFQFNSSSKSGGLDDKKADDDDTEDNPEIIKPQVLTSEGNMKESDG